MNRQKIVFITGPTAVGKTGVSVILAQRAAGEIVNADAMQVYKEVSVASSKPGPEILARVPHHLVGIISVEDRFDVAEYNKLALSAVFDIRRRGRLPVVAGGSGMYIQVLLDGIFLGETKDPQARLCLEDRARREGNAGLYAGLKKADPEAADRIHENDTRRIIRALEVYETMGRPISQMQKSRRGLWGSHDIDIFCLTRERQQLYARIDERVEQMFAAGLVDEIGNLENLKLSRAAQGLIGIEEVRGYLRGEYTIARAKYLMKLHTRHYAKRQMTWFRKDKRLKWVMLGEEEPPENTVERILLLQE